jgi:hypothetical protein
MKNIFSFKKKMEPPVSEYIVLLKNRVTFQLLIYFNLFYSFILISGSEFIGADIL